MIKVSVIVPVWNVEMYIDKCLNSLVNQTLKEIEIIVVNDGSPDNSQTIIDAYVKKYPKKVKSFIKENGGQGSARNAGIEIANGQFISFVDSDDYLDKDALEKMYNFALEKSLEVVVCDMIDHFKDHEVYHDCTNTCNFFEKSLSSSNKIFKKDVIKNVKFLEKVWYEDYNFTLKILLKTTKVKGISEGFYHCTCREGSTMNNNNSKKNLDIITCTDDVIKYSKNNNTYDKNMMSYLIFHHILVTSINRVSLQKSKDKKEVIKKMLKYCKNNIRDYRKMSFYEKEPLSMKIIAFLNIKGLCNVSKLILKINQIMKGKKNEKY